MSATHRLTLKQACELLGKKERTVRRYVQTGLLSKIYVDGENGWELRLAEEEVRALASGARPVSAVAREEAQADGQLPEDPDEEAVGYAAAEGIFVQASEGGPSAATRQDTGGPTADVREPRPFPAPPSRTLRRREDPGDLCLDAAFGPYFELVQREYEGGRDAYLLGLDQILREPRQGDAGAPGKGVWVLHMLRQALGDDRFWPALERFSQDHGFDRGTPAEFMEALEAATGESLRPRYHSWFTHPDLPILAAAWRWDPVEQSVTIALAQTCDPEREAPFYPITTAVLLDSPQGARTVYVTMREPVEAFHVQAPARPRMVLVDPGHEWAMILQASKRTEEWLEQLRRGPDALHRLRAIDGLRGAWGAPEVETALRRVVQEDPSGGVRAAAARALAPVPMPAAPPPFRPEPAAADRPSPAGSGPSAAGGENHRALTVTTSRAGHAEPENERPRQAPAPIALASPDAMAAEEPVSVDVPEGTLPVAAEVEQLKRELRRLRAEQAQIERRLLLLELRTRPRVNEERSAPLPTEGRATEGALPSGEAEPSGRVDRSIPAPGPLPPAN
jgi:hypothetical protein